MNTEKNFSIQVINTITGQTLTTIRARSLDELQARYDKWIPVARKTWRMSAFHAVIKKEVWDKVEQAMNVVDTRVVEMAEA